jgi:3-oxoacyl-[acyl-carrier-protein] synthase II
MSVKTQRPYKNRPVAVTGIGMICPLGLSAPSTWENMLQGKSGIRSITKFDPRECATKIGGQLPEEYLEFEKQKTPKRLFKQTVRATRLARLCAQEAIEDSGALERGMMDPYRWGVVFGTSGSSIRSPEDLGNRSVEKVKVIREMTNAIPAWISIENGFKGPSYTISASCASGPFAVARAVDLIRCGGVDVVVGGGVDCLLTKNNVRRGNYMQMLSEMNGTPEKAVRPFDKERQGWVLSDGGCAVVLESREHALARRARVYAWILGYASVTETYHFFSMNPSGKGMVSAMTRALADSGIAPTEVQYINANGTSTVMNDYLETEAIKSVFGDHAYALYISSQKSMIGHAMGGAGAIEFGVTALVLKNKAIPPTINYEYPDPACDLDYVPNVMRRDPDIQTAMTNSFGLDGHYCGIVMRGEL